YIFCLGGANGTTGNGIPACYTSNDPVHGTFLPRQWIPTCANVNVTNPVASQWTACQGNESGSTCTVAAGSPDGKCHGNPGIRDGARLVWDPDDQKVLILGGKTNVQTNVTFWDSVAQWNPLTSDYCLSNNVQDASISGINLTNGGTGYAVNDVVQINGGATATAAFTVSTISTGGVITGIVLFNTGGGYGVDGTGVSHATTAVSPSVGTGATVHISATTPEFSASACSLPAQSGTGPGVASVSLYFPAIAWDNDPGVISKFGNGGKGVMALVNNADAPNSFYLYSPSNNKWTNLALSGTGPAALPSGSSQPGKTLVHDDINGVLWYRDNYPTANSVDVWEIMDSSISGSAPVQPPPAPTSLTATATSAAVSLSWCGSQGAPGCGNGTATSYLIFQATQTGGVCGSFTQVATSTTTTFTVTGLTNGTTYCFNVEAHNSGGNSAASNTVTATPLSSGP